jgi:hypothetical protein
VLDEVEALFLLERCLQVGGASDQAALALLADPALEDRLDEHRAAALDQGLDLVLARFGAEHLGRREVDEPQQLRAVQHSGQLHGSSSGARAAPAPPVAHDKGHDD